MGEEISMADAISACDPIVTNKDVQRLNAYDGVTKLDPN